MKKLIIMGLALMTMGAYTHANIVRNTVKPIDGYDNSITAIYYHSGGNTYTIGNTLVTTTDNVVDLKVSPGFDQYAVITESKKGDKRAIATYDMWKAENNIAKVGKPLYRPISLSYDPKGQWLAVQDSEAQVHFLHTAKLAERALYKFEAPASVMTIGPTNLLVGAHGNVLEIIDLNNPSTTRKITVSDNINDVKFSTDGSLLGILSDDGKLNVYNTNNFGLEHSIDALGISKSFDFSPNKQYICVLSGPKRISVMNILTPDKREYIDTDQDDIREIKFIKAYEEGKSFLLYQDGNRFVFIDMTHLSPMRSQLLADKLSKKMQEWEAMLPEETLEEYNLRVNDDTRAAQMKLFEQSILAEMVLDEIGLAAVQFGNYNGDMELMELVLNNGFNNLYLSVPKDELEMFLNPSDLEFRNVIYDINKKDEYEVLYADVYNKLSGKTYTYNNLEGQFIDYIVDESQFVPLDVFYQTMLEENSLAELSANIIETAKKDNILSDHTHVTVEANIVPAVDEDGVNITNYEVGVSYVVEQEYSAREDYASGKYLLKDTHAGTAMMEIVDKALREDFAKYLKPGAKVVIEIQGTADASPVRGLIAYQGQYGEIKNAKVLLNGAPATLSISNKGIRSNEELAFLRALGVKEHLYNNIPAINDMNSEVVYNLGVSKEKGSEFRKVGVKFIFIDAFSNK